MEHLPKQSLIIDLTARREARSTILKHSANTKQPLTDLEILIAVKKVFGKKVIPGKSYTILQQEQLTDLDQKGEQAAAIRMSKKLFDVSISQYDDSNRPITSLPSERTLWVVDKIQENKRQRQEKHKKALTRVTIGVVAIMLSALTMVHACDTSEPKSHTPSIPQLPSPDIILRDKN